MSRTDTVSEIPNLEHLRTLFGTRVYTVLYRKRRRILLKSIPEVTSDADTSGDTNRRIFIGTFTGFW